MRIKHIKVITGVNNPAKQVSKDAWNDDHDVSEIGYTHNQASASATWTINHNLGHYPSITLLSAGLSEFMGEVVHTSINQAVAYLATAQAGLAQCN